MKNFLIFLLFLIIIIQQIQLILIRQDLKVAKELSATAGLLAIKSIWMQERGKYITRPPQLVVKQDF